MYRLPDSGRHGGPSLAHWPTSAPPGGEGGATGGPPGGPRYAYVAGRTVTPLACGALPGAMRCLALPALALQCRGVCLPVLPAMHAGLGLGMAGLGVALAYREGVT